MVAGSCRLYNHYFCLLFIINPTNPFSESSEACKSNTIQINLSKSYSKIWLFDEANYGVELFKIKIVRFNDENNNEM